MIADTPYLGYPMIRSWLKRVHFVCHTQDKLLASIFVHTCAAHVSSVILCVFVFLILFSLFCLLITVGCVSVTTLSYVSCYVLVSSVIVHITYLCFCFPRNFVLKITCDILTSYCFRVIGTFGNIIH